MEFLTIYMVFGNLLVTRINNSYFNFYTVYDRTMLDERNNYLELGSSIDAKVALNIIGNYFRACAMKNFIY